jgi:hypothetical protein
MLRQILTLGDTARPIHPQESNWKRAQLPVLTDRKKPIEIMRQVQIAAGAIVVLGIVRGSAVQPAFYLLTAFVGGGLVLAGITGNCAMAALLLRMP